MKMEFAQKAYANGIADEVAPAGLLDDIHTQVSALSRRAYDLSNRLDEIGNRFHALGDRVVGPRPVPVATGTTVGESEAPSAPFALARINTSIKALSESLNGIEFSAKYIDSAGDRLANLA